MIDLINKKLFIFDYDGTIADTNFLHEISFRQVLDFKKLKFNYEKIAGMKTVDAINLLLQENNINLSKDKIKSLVNNKQKIFSNKIEKELKPIAGVVDFINCAKKKYHLCVASSGSKINVYKGLKILGLINEFKYIFCAEDVKMAKPSPEIFLKILSRMNLKIEDAIIFEDSDKGIESAINARIDFVDIRNNNFKELLIYLE
tara:strand:- start:141 stop:746 length:606 start_codon:yes stop_codon:yes gene_type:complete